VKIAIGGPNNCYGGQMSEKRKYMRFNVLIDAICRKCGSSKKLQINNFSKEGVGILSEESFNNGEDVEFEMMIPGDNIPVFFEGEVAWAADLEKNESLYKTGVRLKKIDNHDKSRMLEYIYRKWIVSDQNGSNKSTEEK